MIKEFFNRLFNKEIEIEVILDEGAYMPRKAHSTDAGYDIYAPKSFSVGTRDYAFIDTGVHMLIPDGYVGMIKSKSGLNKNSGILVEGVVDAGYSGSIGLKIYNNSWAETKFFKKGEKVTQIVILPIPDTNLRQVNAFSRITKRGSRGFGSTGK